MSKVLIADDDLQCLKLFEECLSVEGYELTFAETGAQALKLASQAVPDLILLDVLLPDLDGFEVCRHLRLDPLLGEVPILLVTGMEDHTFCVKGLDAGADDVLFKPVNLIELRARVKNIVRLDRYRKLIQERTKHEHTRIERETAYEAALEGWARTLELRGIEPEGHTDRVTRLTLRLAQDLEVPVADQAQIRWGALLHDCGKMSIPDRVLQRARRGSARAKRELRRHPQHAWDLFGTTPSLRMALDLAYNHHERWNGTGYPRGLTGEQIPLSARIFAVADAWDILTSPPPSGKGWSKSFARQQIVAQSGKRFDPRVVQSFERILSAEELRESGDLPVRAHPYPGPFFEEPELPAPNHSNLNLSSRGARLHFLAAFILIAILPMLTFAYLVRSGWIGTPLGWSLLAPLGAALLLLTGLGFAILSKYPSSVIRLRRWVESLSKGDLPMRIDLSPNEDDLIAIEHCLREVIRQSQERIQTLEMQTESLLVAERQRVALESLGAACHHLGQPAATITMALHMLRRANTSPEMVPLIDQCQEAAQSMAEILQKLQTIAHYRTEPYLVSTEGRRPDATGNILKL